MEQIIISIIGSAVSSLYAVGVYFLIVYSIVYFIAKRKKFSARPHVGLIVGIVMLYYGTSTLFSYNSRLPDLLYPNQDTQMELVGHLFFSFWIPIIHYGIAGILLYKSSFVRKLMRRK